MTTVLVNRLYTKSNILLVKSNIITTYLDIPA